MQPVDLENEFTYHPPRGDADVADHQTIREAGKSLAVTIDRLCPDGPHKTLAHLLDAGLTILQKEFWGILAALVLPLILFEWFWFHRKT